MNWSVISKVVGIAATMLGAFLLYRVLGRYEVAAILGALDRFSIADIGLAVVFAIGGFVSLWLAEICAARYAGLDIAVSRIGLTTLAALGIGHALGLAALSSGAVRYRMYGRNGLDLPALGKLTLFAGVTVACSMLAVGAIAMLAEPTAISGLIGVAAGDIRWLGVALLGVLGIYLGLCALNLPEIRIFHMTLALPNAMLALRQVGAGAASYAFVAACLYACLRPFGDHGYPVVAALFVGADTAAVIGHVPGGWGVLEYVMTAALAQPHLITGVLVFRTVYYLAPLLIGLAVFAGDEVLARRTRARASGEPAQPSSAPAAHPAH